MPLDMACRQYYGYMMKGFFTSNVAKLEVLDFMNHCSAMIKEVN